MSKLRLVEISEDGRPDHSEISRPDIAREFCRNAIDLYRSFGFYRPWVGYLAMLGSKVVGTCSFVGPPHNGVVEIESSTFPEFERRGVATSMVRALIFIAQHDKQKPRVIAYSSPTPNPSNAVFRRLGFSFVGSIKLNDGLLWEWRLLENHA